jgi:periplasmic copper chaperone A
MKTISRRNVLALGIMLGIMPDYAMAHDDKHAIIHLMKSMFDTPEAPLAVDPVVIAGDNAIAGWVQGDKGGRALLWRTGGEWQIRLCSGDGLKDPQLLENANIPAADARLLVTELTAAEAALDPSVLARFASFEGTVMIEPGAGHQAHQHGTAATP